MSFELEEVTVLELDLDKCANVYGTALCTAAGAAGSECYNCWASCQDKVNFARSTTTLKFCTRGGRPPPGVQIRPWIVKLKTAPTEIDLEKGLAPRGMVTVTLADPPSSDIDADPYHATRAGAAQGSYWSRLLRRNPNYAGRFARVRTARFTDGWNDAQFIDELYVIERIDPPSGGLVTVVLKDPSKLADRTTTPAPSEGKLAAAILAADPAIPLGAGEAAGYDAAGWVRIGDEVIEYTSIAGDTLNVPVGGRGAFGTTAADASDGESVQLCKVWQSARVHQVLVDLLTDAGMAAGNIDSAGFLAQDDTWLGASFNVTAVISKPEKTSKLLAELVGLVGGVMWWSPTEQKQKFEVVAPKSPADAAVIELTERGHIIEDTVKLETLEALRITVAGIRFDPKSATADLKKDISYLRGELRFDLDAESDNEFGGRRVQIRHARWFTAANAAAVYALVSRRLGHYRDAPIRIHLSLDGKDAGIAIADLVDISVSQLVALDGSPDPKRCIVTRRKDGIGRVDLRLRVTNLGRRWAFWAPAGTGDFPDKPAYAHWAADKTGFPVDGSEPYAWI